MSSYRYRFVGYEKLPSGLNVDDVQLHCRLPDRLVKEIRDSNYAKRYHLGLAVQLSFLALTGRNPDSKLRMPTAMLRLLCEQLGIYSNTTARRAFGHDGAGGTQTGASRGQRHDHAEYACTFGSWPGL